MVTAHIAFLSGLLTADGQPRPVGRVSAANEGAVSAPFDSRASNARKRPVVPAIAVWRGFLAGNDLLSGNEVFCEADASGRLHGNEIGKNWLPRPV